MKKRYQIRKQRAVERFQSWAASRSEPIQLSFPTGAGAELLQQSLGDLLRRVGKMFIETVMEDEVEQLVRERSQPNACRRTYRWGRGSGFCLIDGGRVPIDRTRVRSRQHNRESPLSSYALFQETSLLEAATVARLGACLSRARSGSHFPESRLSRSTVSLRCFFCCRAGTGGVYSA